MCQLFKLQSSAMTGKVAAISFVLIFCFAECAAGSCLSYGHSCWGAHGKRSGTNSNTEGIPLRERGEPLSDTKWIFSRLIQAPVEIQSWKSRNDATIGKHQPHMDNQILNANEGQEEQDIGDVQDVLPSNEDVFYLDDPSAHSRLSEDKIRLFKLMKKTAARFN